MTNVKRFLAVVAFWLLAGVLLAQTASDAVDLIPLVDGVFLHRSFKDFRGTPYPSNGLVVVEDGAIALLDTPYTEEQTRNLLSQIESRFHRPVAFSLVTHAHDDRIGGIRVLLEKGIPVWSSRLTALKALLAGYPAPRVMEKHGMFALGNLRLQVFYPGPGHTADNVVVNLPKKKLLYGGCLIRALEAKNLGNIQDANIKEWGNSVLRVFWKFPETTLVVPGHGEPGGMNLLEHTVYLAQRAE